MVSPRDCYLTPPWLVDLGQEVLGPIDEDPFHHPRSLWRARNVIDERKGGDAYRDLWRGKAAGVNGPYSGDYPARTAARCLEMYRLTGIESINICPAAVGSIYWRKHVWPFAAGIAWLGRVGFIPGEDIYDDEGQLIEAAGSEPKNQNRFEIAAIHIGRKGAYFNKVFSKRFAVVWRGA
jgi:hypothetical protein